MVPEFTRLMHRLGWATRWLLIVSCHGNNHAAIGGSGPRILAGEGRSSAMESNSTCSDANDGNTLGLLNEGKELAHSVIKVLHERHTISVSEFWFSIVASSFMAKAYGTYQAIAHLYEVGCFGDAICLSRSLFEICLQVKYLCEDPIKRTDTYLRYGALDQAVLSLTSTSKDAHMQAFSNILEKQGFEGLLRLKRRKYFELRAAEAGAKPGVKFLNERLKELRKFGKQENLYNWWDQKNIPELAKEVLGEDKWRTHEFFYKFTNSFVHSSALALSYYWSVKESAFEIFYHPQESHPYARFAAIYATFYLVWILEALDIAFELNQSENIAEFERAARAQANNFRFSTPTDT